MNGNFTLEEAPASEQDPGQGGAPGKLPPLH